MGAINNFLEDTTGAVSRGAQSIFNTFAGRRDNAYDVPTTPLPVSSAKPTPTYTPPVSSGAASLTTQGIVDGQGNNLSANLNVSDLTGGYDSAKLASTTVKLPPPPAQPNPDALVASFTPGSFMDGSGFDAQGNQVAAPTTSAKGSTTPGNASADSVNQIEAQVTSPEQKAASAQYDQNYQNAQAASQALQGQGNARLALDKQYGAEKIMSDINDLNNMIAERTKAFNLMLPAQSGQGYTSDIVTGRQALIRQQAAIEIGNLSATQAALSGNLKLAQDRADRVVAAQFQGQQQKLDDAKYFLEQNASTMNREEQRQASKLSAAIQLQENELTRQKEARTFALTNGVTKPFYQVGGTVYSTASGKALSSEADYVAAGGKGDFSDVQKVTASLAGDDLLTTADGSVYVRDATSPTGFKKIISGLGQYSLQTLPDGSTVMVNQRTGTMSLATDASGNIISTGNPVNLGTPVGEIMGLPTYDTESNNPGVTRANRNNNPGNIKASSYSVTMPGVVGVEAKPAADGGNFLIFDSAQSGINAVAQLLQNGNSYQGVTAAAAIKKYNGGGSYSAESLGMNPQANFQTELARLGATNVATKIAQLEGFRGQTTTAKSVNNQVDMPAITNAIDGATKNNEKTSRQQLNGEVQRALQQGDLTAVRERVLGAAQEKMNVSSYNEVKGNNLLIAQMTEVQKLLSAYEAEGGDTGFFTGNMNDLAKQFGRTYGNNSNLTKLGIQAANALISFRRQATGVQFSQKESEEYKTMFPSEGKVGVVNKALIEQLIVNANISNQNEFTTAMGAQTYQQLLDATSPAAQYALGVSQASGTGNAKAGSILDSLFGGAQ